MMATMAKRMVWTHLFWNKVLADEVDDNDFFCFKSEKSEEEPELLEVVDFVELRFNLDNLTATDSSGFFQVVDAKAKMACDL